MYVAKSYLLKILSTKKFQYLNLYLLSMKYLLDSHKEEFFSILRR